MENNSQSYNTTVLGLSPLRFLTPQLPQTVLYFTLTLLFFIGLNISSLWKFFTGDGPGLTQLSANSSGVYRVWHVVSTSNITAALFWGVVGCTFYLAIWFFRSIITNIRNDLVVASYVHPVTYKEYLFWRSLILRKLFFGLAFLMLLIYLFAGLKTMQSLASYGYWRVENGLDYVSCFQIAGAIIAGMLLLHGFTLLLKITLNFWQFIYRDL